jgi:hypothetical protein
MGVSTSEVGYTSAKTGRGDLEVHKGHVVALAKKYINKEIYAIFLKKTYHNRNNKATYITLV